MPRKDCNLGDQTCTLADGWTMTRIDAGDGQFGFHASSPNHPDGPDALAETLKVMKLRKANGARLLPPPPDRAPSAALRRIFAASQPKRATDVAKALPPKQRQARRAAEQGDWDLAARLWREVAHDEGVDPTALTASELDALGGSSAGSDVFRDAEAAASHAARPSSLAEAFDQAAQDYRSGSGQYGAPIPTSTAPAQKSRNAGRTFTTVFNELRAHGRGV